MAVLNLDAGNTDDMALQGLSPQNTGLSGESRAVADRDVQVAGVYGTSANQPDPGRGEGVNVGVWGDSVIDVGVLATSDQWHGVHGYSKRSHGVFGQTDANNQAGVVGDAWNGIGVFGRSYASDNVAVKGSNQGGGPGVWGETTSNKWPAVQGVNWTGQGVRGVGAVLRPPRWVPSNAGVLGLSDEYGVYGFSRGGTGVTGISEEGIGVFGRSDKMAAGHFHGNVEVWGDLHVTGFKFAAVRHPDGSHRGLYAMESPECWFEDFGRAKLVRGRAKIRLDAAFAAIVRTGDYHVFLSPEGDTGGLYVAHRDRRGFEVREHQGKTRNVAFSYRVVARRKDGRAQRFPKVSLPKVKLPRMNRIDLKNLTRTPRPVELAGPDKAPKEWRKLQRVPNALKRLRGHRVARKRRR